MLALLESAEEKSGYDLVRETWKPILGADFDRGWNRVLHDGLLKGSEPSPAAPRIDAKVVADLAKSPPAPSADSFEVVFRASAAVYDGRYANNAWLQELPEPVSKLTWDNAAIVSADTGARARREDRRPRAAEAPRPRARSLPVMILPGSADHSVTLALGYGRTAAGRVGNGVGVQRLRPAHLRSAWIRRRRRARQGGGTSPARHHARSLERRRAA